YADLQLELETSQKQLRTDREHSHAERLRLETRISELQASHASVEQQARRLTESLAKESKRREDLELEAAELSKRQAQLEAELAEKQQAQVQLRTEVEQSHRQIESQRVTYASESEARTRDFQALTSELAAVRSRIEQEFQQRRKLTETIAELESAK